MFLLDASCREKSEYALIEAECAGVVMEPGVDIRSWRRRVRIVPNSLISQ
jgi:hypothetical protein